MSRKPVRGFRGYQSYKKANVPYITRCPKHWKVERLDRIYAHRNEPALADDKLVSAFISGHVTLRENRSGQKIKSSGYEVGYKRILVGDLVVSGMNAHLGGLGISDSTGKGSPVNIVLMPRVRLCGAYFSYLLRHMAVSQYVKSLVRTIRFNSSDFKRNDVKLLWVLRPPVDEQYAIANFLDRETSKIDALISKKERLIELLEEKRTALITQAVTKGLDPDVPMKASGVEWLGDVPEHWGCLRVKFQLRSIEQGWSPLCESRMAETDEWGVLKVGCVNYGRFQPEQHKALPSNLAPLAAYEIAKGDLLVSRANTRELVGSAAVVGEVRPRLLLCDKLYRLRMVSTAHPDYIAAVVNSKFVRFQIEQYTAGASGSMQNISQDVIKNLWLPVPPRSEQFLIGREVARIKSSYAALVTAVEAAIDRLKEYRSALITAAVTGKIDVRESTTS